MQPNECFNGHRLTRRIRNWHLDSTDGKNAILGLGCAAGVGTTVMSAALGTTGCTVQVDTTNTAGSSTAYVTLTYGSVSAVVSHTTVHWHHRVVVAEVGCVCCDSLAWSTFAELCSPVLAAYTACTAMDPVTGFAHCLAAMQ